MTEQSLSNCCQSLRQRKKDRQGTHGFLQLLPEGTCFHSLSMGQGRSMTNFTSNGQGNAILPCVWKEEDTEHLQTALMITMLSIQLNTFNVLKY